MLESDRVTNELIVQRALQENARFALATERRILVSDPSHRLILPVSSHSSVF